MKNDALFNQVTKQIIQNLDGAGRWSKPWQSVTNGEAPHNGITGHAYTGFNWLILSCMASQYNTNQWVTYNQAKAAGGNVMKGEKGTQITYFKMIKREDKETGEDKLFPMLRIYTVFNADQCEGVAHKLKNYIIPEAPKGGIFGFCEAVGADVRLGGDTACFLPSIDQIRMPAAESFSKREHFDSTLLHELTHWTGHASRLDRLKNDRFGSESYAFEELVAELGAAMAGSLLGLPYEGLQHAEYIKSWLKVLKSDPSHIYKAAKLAKKAVEFLADEAAKSGVLPEQLAA